MAGRRHGAAEVSFLVAAVILVAAIATPVGQSPKKAARPAAARMSDALVATLAAEAIKAYPAKFTGVYDVRGEQYRLAINTSRTLLAFKMSQAIVDCGRYTPAALDRLDLLVVDCGESDFGQTFDCARVTVRNAKGSAIKPYAYRPETNAYTNAFGAKWRVREITASYPIAGLIDGFSVDYAGTDGVEYTKEVSAETASGDLMLGLVQP